MQCVFPRWSVHAIGRNTTGSKITVALVFPRIFARNERAFASAAVRWTRDDHATPTPSTLRRSRRNSAPSSKSISTPRTSNPKIKPETITAKKEDDVFQHEPEQWQVQKAALKSKFNNESWNPRKKLSPDTIEGIRTMHSSDPDRFTTPVLAENFQISPEAIRRILKSKWQPSSEEQEERRQRWERRGERVWSNMAEMGVKPPKPWRVRGVGKVSPGETPTWKSRGGGSLDISAKSSREATMVRRGLVAAKASSGNPTTSIAVGKSISGRIL